LNFENILRLKSKYSKDFSLKSVQKSNRSPISSDNPLATHNRLNKLREDILNYINSGKKDKSSPIHPASDVLSLRFCSCVCNRGNSRELLRDYCSSSWRVFHRCDVGEPVLHR